MPRSLRVFLCHASQDKPAVWKLYRYLKQHGVKPWLDQADLLPGEDWEVEIPNALFLSDIILVCLSKNSVDKEGYVQKEISFALDKALEKPGKIFIIPVKLEECDIPKRLNRYQWVDLSRPDGRKRLLMGLDKRVTELGPDVLPLILEDMRKGNPTSKSIPSTDKITNERIKARLEKTQDETTERFARKQTEHEERDKAAREKGGQEEADRIAREKLNNIIAEEIIQENAQREVEEKLAREKANREAANFRRLGIRGIILLTLILGGLGLNSLLNKSTTTINTPASPSFTEIFKSLTSDAPQPTAVPPTVGPEEFFTEEFDDSADMENWVAFSFGPGADDNANLRIEQEGEGVTFDLGALDLYEYYMYTPFTYRDVKLTVVAENRGVNNNVSLVCRLDADNSEWYEFSFDSGGVWYLYAYKDGYTILDNGGSNNLKQGKAINEYGMTCEGNVITMYINGKELKSFTDRTYNFGEGQVGFNISSLNVLPVIVNVQSFDIATP